MPHSSLQVPPGVAQFFTVVTGMPWPKSDEGGLRDVRDDYQALAEELPKLRQYIADLVGVCRSRFEGEAADAFVREMGRFIGADGDEDFLTTAGKMCAELAAFAGKVANSVEYTKWMAIGQLVQLLFEIALAIFWAPFTGGASLLAAAGAKLVVREILLNLLKKLLQLILTHTFFGIVGGLALDAIIQGVQFGQGNRTEWDKEATRQAAIFGTLGGLIGGPLQLLGMGLAKLFGSGLGKLFVSRPLGAALTGGAKELPGSALTTTVKRSGTTVGRELGESSAVGLAGGIDGLLREYGGFLAKGFGTGRGAGLAGRGFVERFETVFEKHLAADLGANTARTLGREIGEAFTRHWAKSPESREAFGHALKKLLDNPAAVPPQLRALADRLPELVGRAEKMNTAFLVGHALGEMVQSGANNMLSEGFYNLIWGPNHEFTTSGASFLGGFLMGGMNHLGHFAASPLMTRYRDFVIGLQHQGVTADQSKYFGPLHPLTLLSVASNLAGHNAPFPVPRLGAHVPLESDGASVRTGGGGTASIRTASETLTGSGTGTAPPTAPSLRTESGPGTPNAEGRTSWNSSVDGKPDPAPHTGSGPSPDPSAPAGSRPGPTVTATADHVPVPVPEPRETHDRETHDQGMHGRQEPTPRESPDHPGPGNTTPSGRTHDYVEPPPHTGADDPRRADWQDAQRRLQDTYDALLTDTAPDHGTTPDPDTAPSTVHVVDPEADRRLRRAFDTGPARLRDGWQPDNPVFRRATDLLHSELATRPEARREILDGIDDLVALAAARQLAADTAARRFDQVFDTWADRAGADLAHEIGTEAGPDALSPIRRELAARFREEAEHDIAQLFPTRADVTPDRIARAREALDRRADHLARELESRTATAAAVHRLTTVVEQRAGSAWRGELSERDARLLEVTGADNDSPLSRAGLDSVAAKVRDRLRSVLDSSVTQLPDTGTETDPRRSRTDEDGGDTVDLLADLPHRFAVEAAREATAQRIAEAVRTAVDDWTDGMPAGLGDRSADVFGLDASRISAHAEAVTKLLTDRADTLLDRHDDPDSGAYPLKRALDRLVEPERIHRMLALHTAREHLSEQAGQTAHDRARARTDLTAAAAERLREGHAARVRDAFDEAFADPDALRPYGLPERLEQWQRTRERLDRELDAHLDFEAAVLPALRRASDGFDELAGGRPVAAERIAALKRAYGRDFFDAYHRAWGPEGLDGDRWRAHEEQHEGVFTERSRGSDTTGPDLTGPDLVRPDATGVRLLTHRPDTVDVLPDSGTGESVRPLSDFAAGLRGLWLPDPAAPPAARHETESALARFPQDDGRYVVAVHAGPDGLPRRGGETVRPEDMAELLATAKEEGAWNGTDELLFVACNLARGLDSAYVPEVMRLLGERGLGTTALAPDRAVWFVPAAGPDGRPTATGRGHLVVTSRAGVDARGRIVVEPGGDWIQYTRSADGTPDILLPARGPYLPPAGSPARTLPEHVREADQNEIVARLDGAIPFSPPPPPPPPPGQTSSPASGPAPFAWSEESEQQVRAAVTEHLDTAPTSGSTAPNVQEIDRVRGNGLLSRYTRVSLVDFGSPGTGHQVAHLRVLDGLAEVGYRGEVHLSFSRGKALFYATHLGREADIHHPERSYGLFHQRWVGQYRGLEVVAHPVGDSPAVRLTPIEKELVGGGTVPHDQQVERYWKNLGWPGARPADGLVADMNLPTHQRRRYTAGLADTQSEFMHQVTSLDNLDRPAHPRHLLDVLEPSAPADPVPHRTLTVFAALDSPYSSPEQQAGYFTEIHLETHIREMTGEQQSHLLVLQPFLWEKYPREIRLRTEGDVTASPLWPDSDRNRFAAYPWVPRAEPQDLMAVVEANWREETGAPVGDTAAPVSPQQVGRLLERARDGEIRLVTAYYGQSDNDTTTHDAMFERVGRALRAMPATVPNVLVLLGAQHPTNAGDSALAGLETLAPGSLVELRLGRVAPPVMELFQRYSRLVVTEGANTWQEILALGTPGISPREGGETRPWERRFEGPGAAGGDRILAASRALQGGTPQDIVTLTGFIEEVENGNGAIGPYVQAWRTALLDPANDQFRQALDAIFELTPMQEAQHFGPPPGPAPTQVTLPPSADRRTELRNAIVRDGTSGAHWLDDPAAPPDARRRTADSVARFPVDDRFLTLAVHTGADGVPRWRDTPVTPGELADVLVSLHEEGVWDGVKPLQLAACWTAREGGDSYAADVLRALHHRLPGLNPEVYAPSGLLWFAPGARAPFESEPTGPGHLVVGKQPGFDRHGRPVLVEDGSWMHLSLPKDAGTAAAPEVRRLGAHLPVGTGLPPTSADAPPGFTVLRDGPRRGPETVADEDAVAFTDERPGGSRRRREGDDEQSGGQDKRGRFQPDDSSDAEMRSEDEDDSSDDSDDSSDDSSEDNSDDNSDDSGSELYEQYLSRVSRHLNAVGVRREELALLEESGADVDQDRKTTLDKLHTAFGMIHGLGLIRSPHTVTELLPFVTDRIFGKVDRPMLLNHQQSLSTGSTAPLATEHFRALHTAVMARYDPDGGPLDANCEFRAHAVAELLHAVHLQAGRHSVFKIWAYPEQAGQTLNLEHNWQHHVAVLVRTTDGDRVIDPLLFPNEPVTVEQWSDSVSSGGQTPLRTSTLPWEFLGRPNLMTGRADAGSIVTVDGSTRAAIDNWKRPAGGNPGGDTDMTPMGDVHPFGETDPHTTGEPTTADLIELVLSGRPTPSETQPHLPGPPDGRKRRAVPDDEADVPVTAGHPEAPPAKRHHGTGRDATPLVDRGAFAPTPEQHRALLEHLAAAQAGPGAVPRPTPELLARLNPTGDTANCLDANLALWDTLDGDPHPAGTRIDGLPERDGVWELSRRVGPAWHYGTGAEGLRAVADLVRSGGPGSRALVLTAEQGRIGHAYTLLHTDTGDLLLVDPQQHTVVPLDAASAPADGASVWAYVEDTRRDQLRGDGHYDESLYWDRETGSPSLVFGMAAPEKLFAHTSFFEHPAWKERAEEFEKQIGAYALRLARQEGSAVSQALHHLRSVLKAYYDEAWNDGIHLREVFTHDDVTSAGQIRHSRLTAEDITKMMTLGNPREQYTAFYNAAYYQSGKPNGFTGGVGNLKVLLQELFKQSDLHTARELGLDVERLQPYRDQLDGMMRKAVQGALTLVSERQAGNYAPDPFALGNLLRLSDKPFANTEELASSQYIRTPRPDEMVRPNRLTPAQLRRAGVELSRRERALLLEFERLALGPFTERKVPLEVVPFNPDGTPNRALIFQQFPDVADVRFTTAGAPDAKGKVVTTEVTIVFSGIVLQGMRASDLQPLTVQELEAVPDGSVPQREGPEFPLGSIEGIARYQLDETGSWYRDLDRRGIPVIGGLSGTTTRMLSAFDWLNVPGARREDFVAGLIGWMLQPGDHSLYEILRGAQIAGFDGIDGKAFDLTDAVTMYRSLDALGPEFNRPALRRLMPDGVLPHERLYREQLSADGKYGGFYALSAEQVDRAMRFYERRIREGQVKPNSHLQKWLDDHGLTAQRLSEEFPPAHLLAVRAYTGSDHRLINLVVERTLGTGSGLPFIDTVTEATRWVLQEMLVKKLGGVPFEEPSLFFKNEDVNSLITEYHKQLELRGPEFTHEQRSVIRQKLDGKLKELLPTVVAEAKTHATMLMEALGVLPAVRERTVYRGGWEWGGSGIGTVLAAFRAKDTVEFDTFASTSKEQATAQEFLGKGSFPDHAHRVFYKLTLNGFNGRDITPFSSKRSEAEVLLLPGARFRVTRRELVKDPRGDTARDYVLVEAEEIAPRDR
ncbi:protein-glutamine glutaminase family protein [Kitasatospora sp. KL5]|uniref:WXG100-like domain-containing protein n=1 Tax=Kitasatospora sp. KL5 TaxID=3425125 RepID=UPI003D6F12AB